MVTDPYEDDDDSPTLQRPAPPSATMQRAPRSLDVGGFAFEESSTDTDLDPLADPLGDSLADALADPLVDPLGDSLADPLADAHTVDALPPDAAIARVDAPDYSDMETPKIPLDVAAVLLRASQDDDGSAT